ncbi:MAG: WecB/TagA/CpsF family glycosyltransferase, partial [Parvularculaceae bacterium]|nr:WecB/TagA/CpsF family glycosyltransferase [Parvularculaceae bacterium]
IAAPPQAVQAIELAIRDGRRLRFVTPNLNYFMRAANDPQARRQLVDSDLCLADGAPIVMLASALGAPIGARCAGSDVFEILRRRPGFAGRRIRVFFFGGRDDSAERAAAAVDAERRGVEAAGHLNPGFGDIDEMSADHIIDAINEANADFVLVALGAAKGECWIEKNRDRLNAPVIAHLGAVVDFAAGAVARAPVWVRKTGLEWAWRIKEDPSLWRRYWHDGAGLAWLAMARLAPALVFARPRRTGAPARADVSAEDGRICIALSGDLVASDREPVRRAFREATTSGGDIVLDMSGAGAADAAFLGQVLMLEKAQRRAGRRLLTRGLSPAMRRLFSAHMLQYAEAENRAVAAQEFAAA